jgi:hypothetical protein
LDSLAKNQWSGGTYTWPCADDRDLLLEAAEQLKILDRFRDWPE